MCENNSCTLNFLTPGMYLNTIQYETCENPQQYCYTVLLYLKFVSHLKMHIYYCQTLTDSVLRAQLVSS